MHLVVLRQEVAVEGEADEVVEELGGGEEGGVEEEAFVGDVLESVHLHHFVVQGRHHCRGDLLADLVRDVLVDHIPEGLLSEVEGLGEVSLSLEVQGGVLHGNLHLAQLHLELVLVLEGHQLQPHVEVRDVDLPAALVLDPVGDGVQLEGQGEVQAHAVHDHVDVLVLAEREDFGVLVVNEELFDLLV